MRMEMVMDRRVNRDFYIVQKTEQEWRDEREKVLTAKTLTRSELMTDLEGDVDDLEQSFISCPTGAVVCLYVCGMIEDFQNCCQHFSVFMCLFGGCG